MTLDIPQYKTKSGPFRCTSHFTLRTSRSVRTGFTLIELLVVIAIISLLVSILLPSLQKAKRLAKITSCASQLRHIGTALHMFANENDGRFPARALDSTGGRDWKNLARPLMLDIEIIGDTRMFMCPSGTLLAPIHAIPPGPPPLATAYRYIDYQARWDSTANQYSVSSPSGIVLVSDVCGWWGFWAHEPHRGGLREGSGINRLFNDGAVEWFDQFSYGFVDGDDVGYRGWYKPFDRPGVPQSWYVLEGQQKLRW